jgi:large subunit ribosomal protein L18
MHKNKKISGREKRHTRVREKIRGTEDRPRLVVFRSLKHIYAQVVDDDAGSTLCAASSLEPKLKDKVAGGNVDGAKAVGEEIGRKAVARNIERVVFDRSGYKYHGRVKALADGAREAGLKF